MRRFPDCYKSIQIMNPHWTIRAIRDWRTRHLKSHLRSPVTKRLILLGRPFIPPFQPPQGRGSQMTHSLWWNLSGDCHIELSVQGQGLARLCKIDNHMIACSFCTCELQRRTDLQGIPAYQAGFLATYREEQVIPFQILTDTKPGSLSGSLLNHNKHCKWCDKICLFPITASQEWRQSANDAVLQWCIFSPLPTEDPCLKANVDLPASLSCLHSEHAPAILLWPTPRSPVRGTVG